MVAVPVTSIPYMKYVPLDLPAGIVTLIEVNPASVPVVDNETMPAAARLTTRPFVGAAAPRRIIVPVRSRFLPMVLPSSRTIFGWPTVALMVAYWVGVAYPAGVTAVNTVVPELAAWNWTVAVLFAPVITAGEPLIVPTAVFELVTVTLAVSPPARACVSR